MSTLTPTFVSPHDEARRLIDSKTILQKSVFYKLLPELRARAFTVSGMVAADALQRTRDAIATIPQGANWDEAKQTIVDELKAASFTDIAADRRAELLIRTHAFQAYQAANWRVAQEDVDTTHLQYLTLEDDRVRDTHAALNGLILPKDDPFWNKHYPPWEWGCRCQTRPINPDLLQEAKDADTQLPPEDRNVIEGPALQRLRNGQLTRGSRSWDVTPPSDGPQGDAFQFHPDNLRLPVADLEQRYSPEVWSQFRTWSQQTPTAPAGPTVWQWLHSKPSPVSPVSPISPVSPAQNVQLQPPSQS